MSELLGMSFDSSASPSITLKRWGRSSRSDRPPTGWGFGWYPDNDLVASVIKDPMPTGDTALSKVLQDWDRFRATIFLCHVRGAAKRVNQGDTHPFLRSYAGRDWLLVHTGELDPRRSRALDLGDPPLFEPTGRTDSERAFCWLLHHIHGGGYRRLADVPPEELRTWFLELNAMGTLNVLMSDGFDLVAYRDQGGFRPMCFTRRVPPHDVTRLENLVVQVDIGDPLDINRTMVLIGTTPLEPSPAMELAPAELLIARRGAVMWRSTGPTTTSGEASARETPAAAWEESQMPQAAGGRAEEVGRPTPPRTGGPIGAQVQRGTQRLPRTKSAVRLQERVLNVRHETVYKYKEPVERSTHLFRLRPAHDLGQEVLAHTLEITPRSELLSFEDVFGNYSSQTKLREPFKELKIVATSRVRLRRSPPLASPTRRTTIPLVWMPWQRQMMNPYLLPPELPETQLRELSEFAMSFVERQDSDLVETLADINHTIRHDFAYTSKSTTLATTPFDVYTTRRGVCQDFANLFICLARLLGVPARYRTGYIFTGADYENAIQSEASHAWVEVYLPWAGWRGFDPTNGCVADIDHVRVAVGRNYRDATPTSGTIFKGGEGETLHVSVRVEPDEGDVPYKTDDLPS